MKRNFKRNLLTQQHRQHYHIRANSKEELPNPSNCLIRDYRDRHDDIESDYLSSTDPTPQQFISSRNTPKNIFKQQESEQPSAIQLVE